jgi:putative glutamine amidotransferase
MRKPKIGVLMDENSSAGGNQYAMSNAYFEAIARAGGIAFGIPYAPHDTQTYFEMADGLLCPGGRFAFADEHYAYGLKSLAPKSDRFEAEKQLIEGFLAADKPILGICSGMQLLGCLMGAKMSPDLRATERIEAAHDEPGRLHKVNITPRTQLHEILGEQQFEVNTYHREVLVSLSDDLVISAASDDGLIEAIEVPSKKFAIGVQWHPERDDLPQDPSTKLFEAFVAAAT